METRSGNCHLPGRAADKVAIGVCGCQAGSHTAWRIGGPGCAVGPHNRPSLMRDGVQYAKRVTDVLRHGLQSPKQSHDGMPNAVSRRAGKCGKPATWQGTFPFASAMPWRPWPVRSSLRSGESDATAGGDDPISPYRAPQIPLGPTSNYTERPSLAARLSVILADRSGRGRGHRHCGNGRQHGRGDRRRSPTARPVSGVGTEKDGGSCRSAETAERMLSAVQASARNAVAGSRASAARRSASEEP